MTSTGTAAGPVARDRPQVALPAGAHPPVGDALAVRRPAGLHRVDRGPLRETSLRSGRERDRDELTEAGPRVGPDGIDAARAVDDLAAVGRPGRAEAVVGHPPHGLAARAHHEDPAAVAVRVEGDLRAVRGERRRAVVHARVGRQVDRVGAAGALHEDVAVAAVLGDERKRLALGRHARGLDVAHLEREPREARDLCGPARRPPRRVADPGAQSDQPGGRERRGQRSDAQPAAAGVDGSGRFAGLRAAQRLDRERQVAGRLEALVGALLEAVPEHALEPGAGPSRAAARGETVEGVLLEDRRHRLGRRLPLEGALPGRHLEQHRAEREDVGALVHDLAAHLLGRHVDDGPRNGARRGVVDLGGRGGVAAERARLGLPREPEVEHLDAPVGRQEQVLGLEVAVDDPLLVRRRESMRDLRRVLRGLARRQRAGLEPLAQRFALQQLHDGVGHAVRGAEVEDREDVRVRERGDRARLALEARERLGVGRNPLRQHLERDVARQPRVARAVDLAHSSRAERSQDLVGTDARTRREAH